MFRRDLSCNRVYVNGDGNGHASNADTTVLLEDARQVLCGRPWVLWLINRAWAAYEWRIYREKDRGGLGSDAVDGRDPNRSFERENDLPTKKLDGRFSVSGEPQSASSYYLTNVLPVDAQIHLFNFLDVKDIISFSSSSRSTHNIIHGKHYTSPSNLVWRSLFLRDFHHVLKSKYIQSALSRFDSYDTDDDTITSRLQTINHALPTTSIQQFYFEFQLSWLCYVIAGHNTEKSCLIGLFNNVLDITDFIPNHPGSTETLLMHAGCDATQVFTHLNHSKTAQSLANSKIAIKQMQKIGTLLRFRNWYRNNFRAMEIRANKQMRPDVVGTIRVYYDPVHSLWRSWYSSSIDFQPVFLETCGDEI